MRHLPFLPLPLFYRVDFLLSILQRRHRVEVQPREASQAIRLDGHRGHRGVIGAKAHRRDDEFDALGDITTLADPSVVETLVTEKKGRGR